MTQNNIPNINQVLQSFSTVNGDIAFFKVDGTIQANVLSVGNTIITSDNFVLANGTVGGVTMSNGTISSSNLGLQSASSIIDFHGATLVNVSGISMNPNNYTTVFTGIQSNPGQTVLAGSISLPLTGCVAILSPEFIASRPTGLSVAGTMPAKVNYVGGTMTFKDYKNISLAADDPSLSMCKVTFTQSGNNVNVMAVGADLYTLSWIVTLGVTILPL